jgi:hypothetical protein
MPDDKPLPPAEESFGARAVRVVTAAIKVAVMGEEPETTIVPPSQCTDLRETKKTSTSVTLEWKAPATGTKPIHYTVFYKTMHAEYWSVGATSEEATTATVTGLKPSTEYEFEIFAHSV